MGIEEIVEYINFITLPRLLRFISEKGENCCDECQKYHGMIFEENAKNIPQIPIHPNCRCKYEYVSENDLAPIKKTLKMYRHNLITGPNKYTHRESNCYAMLIILYRV